MKHLVLTSTHTLECMLEVEQPLRQHSVLSHRQSQTFVVYLEGNGRAVFVYLLKLWSQALLEKKGIIQ